MAGFEAYTPQLACMLCGELSPSASFDPELDCVACDECSNEEAEDRAEQEDGERKMYKEIGVEDLWP